VSAREIASIAFGRFRKGWLVALRAYFDRAGDEADRPVITVGGFLADSSVCEDIERDWETATGKRTFHLTDFGTKYCALGSGEWTPPERASFLKKLAGIVNRPGCYIVSASLEVAPFNEAIRKIVHPQELGPASSVCAYAAVVSVEVILTKEQREQQKVHYAFEKGDREHEISNVFSDFEEKNSRLSGLRGHSFLPKDTTLLQLADFISGTVQRCLIKAHTALACLDNGLARTQLQTFQRHYSRDGVTAAVVAGHDSDKCWIFNPSNVQFLGNIGKRFFERYPEQLPKRKKRLPYKPKQAKR